MESTVVTFKSGRLEHLNIEGGVWILVFIIMFWMISFYNAV